MDLISPRRGDAATDTFRDEVGPSGPVCVVGGRTHWSAFGDPAPGTREVRAPVGVVALEPSELIVRVHAGTAVDELAEALAGVGQCVALPSAPGGTVGGALALGRSDVHALGRGPVRSTLLEVTFVDAWGRLARAGAPVVKNVTGFDLCRLLVGSLGTLGLLGEVVLRTRPAPDAGAWWSGPADAGLVGRVRAAVERPDSILWDGRSVWVHVEGHAGDVRDAGVAVARLGCAEAAPPALPPVRSSVPPGAVVAAVQGELLAGRAVVAEVGVGVLHGERPLGTTVLDDALVALHRTVKARFDPEGRLNPGRSVLAVGAGC